MFNWWWKLPIGMRSVLIGAHCFFLHPWFVAWAWWILNGFPWDPRLWVAFFVHDLGYFFQACPNMDGAEGEEHPRWGAGLMHALFDWWRWVPVENVVGVTGYWVRSTYWRDFCLYHSRYFCKKYDKPQSPLCLADKLSLVLVPAWLYLPMARLTGEIEEYMRLAREGKYVYAQVDTSSQKKWYGELRLYLVKWVVAQLEGELTPTKDDIPDGKRLT